MVSSRAQSRAARSRVKPAISRLFRPQSAIFDWAHQSIGWSGIAAMSEVTKILKDAIETVATLPEAEQDKIGRELLDHVEKLRALKADLQEGIASLDAGRGRKLDMKEVIARARARHAKR
jgi:hypothetical protein